MKLTEAQELLAQLYIPLHDRVLVEVDPEVSASETTTEAGIILGKFAPDGSGASQSLVRRATVLAVGTGEILYDGKVRKLQTAPGKRVLLHVNEVLQIQTSLDPTDPIIGFISERNLIAEILEGETVEKADPNQLVLFVR